MLDSRFFFLNITLVRFLALSISHDDIIVTWTIQGILTTYYLLLTMLSLIRLLTLVLAADNGYVGTEKTIQIGHMTTIYLSIWNYNYYKSIAEKTLLDLSFVFLFLNWQSCNYGSNKMARSSARWFLLHSIIAYCLVGLSYKNIIRINGWMDEERYKIIASDKDT